MLGVRRPDTLAAGLFSHVLQSVRHEPMICEGESDLDIIVYDLVRALFGSPGQVLGSPQSDRLFQRICCCAKRHFTNPDFGPAEIAAEVGISLRYLQKLFTSRGTTCSQYIQSLRLGHAFMLLARRAEGVGGKSVCEIAWESGYRELSHFYRVFRQRFGQPPGCVGQRRPIFAPEDHNLNGRQQQSS
jgi:AraC-like DNA-binding protein